jgi:hypothetical protein
MPSLSAAKRGQSPLILANRRMLSVPGKTQEQSRCIPRRGEAPLPLLLSPFVFPLPWGWSRRGYFLRQSPGFAKLDLA